MLEPEPAPQPKEVIAPAEEEPIEPPKEEIAEPPKEVKVKVEAEQEKKVEEPAPPAAEKVEVKVEVEEEKPAPVEEGKELRIIEEHPLVEKKEDSVIAPAPEGEKIAPLIEPVEPAAVPPKPPQESPQPELNPRQKKAVEYLKVKGRITRKEYSELFVCSIPTAARDLKELLDLGVIVGKGPFAIGRYYELSKK